MSDAIQFLNASAAIWAAVAATFSAIATVLLWRTEQRSFRHSARPELVLAGWERGYDPKGPSTPDRIAFSAIANIGRGPALHVHINSFSLADDARPMTVMSTIRQSLITRTVTAAPVWRLKLHRSLSKVPLIGKCYCVE